MKTDPFRPLGYRFVVQFVDELTAEAALARYERMSGKDKASKAKVVAGCRYFGSWRRRVMGNGDQPTGFRVYLPCR